MENTPGARAERSQAGSGHMTGTHFPSRPPASSHREGDIRYDGRVLHAEVGGKQGWHAPQAPDPVAGSILVLPPSQVGRTANQRRGKEPANHSFAPEEGVRHMDVPPGHTHIYIFIGMWVTHPKTREKNSTFAPQHAFSDWCVAPHQVAGGVSTAPADL